VREEVAAHRQTQGGPIKAGKTSTGAPVAGALAGRTGERAEEGYRRPGS